MIIQNTYISACGTQFLSTCRIIKHTYGRAYIHPSLLRIYKEHICHEINELLLQSGNAVVAELSKRFSLPLSYITEVLKHYRSLLVSVIIHY